MKCRPWIALGCLLSLGIIAAAEPAGRKLGVVHLTVLFEKNPRRASAESKLKAVKTQGEETLKALEAKVKAQRDQLQLLEKSTTRYKDLEKELYALEQELKYEHNRCGQEYVQLVRQQREELLAELRKVIAAYGRTHGFDAILQQELTLSSEELSWSSVLYHAPECDLTEAILAELAKP
ncbi:MAG: OmpH family outer membrane protein [Planctomycetota bacterium]